MKNTVNSTIIRNRYNVLPDEATHEKAVLLSLLISCNIPYHMNNGHVVLDSKKGLKLADIKAYYDKYNDSEVLAILIDSDIWYTVSAGKLTYIDPHNEASATDKKVACKTKAEKKGEHTMKLEQTSHNQHLVNLLTDDIDSKMDDFADIYGDEIRDMQAEITEAYLELVLDNEEARNDLTMMNAAERAWKDR